jgi:hypothetical protein
MVAKKTSRIFTFCYLLAFIFIPYFIKAQQWGDYTLYSVMNSTSTYLLDTNGNTFKTWSHASTAKSSYSCYLMPGGYLWRSVARTGNSFTGGPISGQVQKVAWDGTVLWDFVYSTSDYCSHHDICPLPNGNILLIAYERKSSADVKAAGGTFSGEMWSEKVVEIKPTGATTGDVVWEWKVWDHIVQDKDATKPNYQASIVNHPELLNVNYKATKDWIHMNGIDYNPILDQIAVSSHNLNEWYLIDHSTSTTEAASHSGGNSGKGGDFLYRWGNPAAYNASGTQVLKVTHDAHWIPEGTPNAGRLVGFNNQGVSTSKSSVDQIVTPVNGYNYDITIGSAYEPSAYTRHACNGYTSNAGSSEQLPNGNMMVCIALSGYIYEIDPAGNSIWSKTVTGASQQAHRYEKCFTDNEPPAIPTITNNSNILTASAATTYQWYLNGQKINGANSQTYMAKTDGIYVVRITDNNGCVFRYSIGYKVKTSTTFNVSLPNNSMAICAGQTAQINPSTNNEVGNTSFLWTSTPAGFTSISKNISVSPNVNTTYKLVATNNGVKDSASVLVSINPKPLKPIITQNGGTLKSSNGVSYKWFEDTVLISNATGTNYSPTKSGQYRVKITDIHGCQSDFSDAFNFTLGSIIPNDIYPRFLIYPNPSQGNLTILNKDHVKYNQLQLYDIHGHLVLKSHSLENIDIQHLDNGLYLLKILSDSHIIGNIKIILRK